MLYSLNMSIPFNGIRQIAIGCIFLFTLSCVRKTPADSIPRHLKSAWLSYLKRQPNYDSSRVRFEVQDVYYFADTAAYICQFKVRMQVPSRHLDTVGMMSGTISRDFTVVHRKS